MPPLPDPPSTENAPRSEGGLLMLAALALIVGAAAGVIGAVFRLALEYAEHLRERLIGWSHDHRMLGLAALIGVCAAAAALAAWMVRRFSPLASGSGIPHVEAVLRRDLPQAPARLIPVKFLGGVLAIGSGMALGREGPSVQMGASAAHLLGRIFRRGIDDCLTLAAAGAGAGLATAFNAPIAGAVFVLEELVRRFDTRITIATFGASAGAIAVSRAIIGGEADFTVHIIPQQSPWATIIAVVLGLGMGVLGVLYNKAILGALAGTARLKRVPVECIAALIGAGIGVLAWSSPGLVGGGDALTQKILSGGVASAGVLALVLGVRFVLGPVSYAARTPGGLFAPMLVLGAAGGMLFGLGAARVCPSIAPDPIVMAVVGMAAFFTAVVRAPVTGIVLVTEMTGCYHLFLPLLAASFAAMVVPTLLRDEPIYDALRVGGPPRS